MQSKAHDGVVPRVAQNCKKQARRSVQRAKHGYRRMSHRSETLHIGYTGHWSEAMKLYGEIVVLQKKGWVQQLCPPPSSFSALLPSQQISCQWEPSSLPLLQSEQHVPQRNETTRPTVKTRHFSGCWTSIIKKKVMQQNESVSDQLYFTAKLSKILAQVRHDRQVMWPL